jgi:hypothetical protein
VQVRQKLCRSANETFLLCGARWFWFSLIQRLIASAYCKSFISPMVERVDFPEEDPKKSLEVNKAKDLDATRVYQDSRNAGRM